MENVLNILALVVLLGIAGEYILRSMLLMERNSHEGPFKSRHRYIRFPDTGHMQHVALFDWVRRAAGAYEVKGYQWTVRENDERSERFTCPHCLSYWTSLIFSLPLSLHLFGLSWELLWFIPVHLSIAVISQIAHKVLWGDD